MIRIFLLYSGLMGWLCIQAQPQIKVEHFSSEEGFFGRFAQEIMQDSRGFLWIATVNGAYRYDGYSFTAFSNEGEGYISTLYEDKKGNVWLGLHTTVVCIDPETDSQTSFTYNPNPGGYEITYLLTEDQSGNIWIVSGMGLFTFNKQTNQFELYKIHEDLTGGPERRPANINRDQSGNIWLGTADKGLFHFDINSKAFKHYTHDPSDDLSLGSNEIKSLHVDPQGMLWVVTANGLIQSLDPHKEQFRHYHFSDEDKKFLVSQTFRRMAADRSNNLWIASSQGLIRLQLLEHKLEFFQPDPNNINSINGDEIRSVFVDREENVWISPSEYGLDRINIQQNQFTFYQHNPSESTSLSSSNLTSVDVDSNQIAWVGTFASGLNRLDLQTGKVTRYAFDPGKQKNLSNKHVQSLLLDSRNNLWIGTKSGLNLFYPNSNQFKHFYADPGNLFGLSGNNINEILEDSQKRLWISVFEGGLNCYDYQSGNFTHYRNNPDNPHSLSSDLVTVTYEDKQGILWIGTAGRGLNRLDPEDQEARFYHYLHNPQNPNSISSNGVFALHEDKKGNFWIGTWRGGLNLLDREKDIFHHFTEKDGLASNVIQHILEDHHGHLWLSTINGLSRFDPETRSFTNYDQSDGLPGSVFNMYASASINPKTGELYFASQKGLVVFHPDSLVNSDFVPPVLITSLEYISKGSEKPDPVKGISLRKEVQLSHLDDIINIQFSALSFTKAHKNQYRYQMEGLNDKWIELGTQRRISFTDLNPGMYTLRVMGANGDGYWNPIPTELIIHISPPWWQTRWAYTTYLLLALVIIYTIIRWRTYSLRRQRQLLRTRVFEQTREIRAEQERSDELLLNILPAAVAQELKTSGKTQPVFFEEVSIMFSDFKGFTNIVATIPGKKLIAELDDIFQAYDDIMEEVGLEKISTVGDAYLAAGGLPIPDPDHAKKCVIAGQRIISFLKQRNQTETIKWNVRIGIHSGTITAGVIGKKKFAYDLFGDTINIAARIESASEPDRINVSAYTADLIKDRFPCTYRGKIDAKGKGELDMYFVDGMEEF